MLIVDECSLGMGQGIDRMIQEKNTSAQRKACSSAVLSTTKPTWAALGLIPGLYGGRLVTNSLSHGMAIGFI